MTDNEINEPNVPARMHDAENRRNGEGWEGIDWLDDSFFSPWEDVELTPRSWSQDAGVE